MHMEATLGGERLAPPVCQERLLRVHTSGARLLFLLKRNGFSTISSTLTQAWGRLATLVWKAPVW